MSCPVSYTMTWSVHEDLLWAFLVLIPFSACLYQWILTANEPGLNLEKAVVLLHIFPNWKSPDRLLVVYWLVWFPPLRRLLGIRISLVLFRPQQHCILRWFLSSLWIVQVVQLPLPRSCQWWRKVTETDFQSRSTGWVFLPCSVKCKYSSSW